MEAAAAFLAVRPRSVVETRRRLWHLGYPRQLVEQVLDRLTEMRYLDDAAFARAWVDSRDRARPRGEGALRQELGRKGIAPELVRTVLDERRDGAGSRSAAADAAGSDRSDRSPDAVAARRLVDRRRAVLMREQDPRKRRQKAYALLARNGFAPDVCRATAAWLDADTDSDVDELETGDDTD